MSNLIRRLLGYLFVIIANLVLLVGALWLGWNAWQIIFLYWGESLIIALFGLAKVSVCSFTPLSSITLRTIGTNLFILILFTVFFFGFLGILGGILHANMYLLSGFEDSYNPFWTEDVPFTMAYFINSPLFALSAFFLIQLYLFIDNFLILKRYRTGNIQRFLGEPLKRIVIMHIAAIAGGWFIVSRYTADPPNYVFLVWIGLKFFLDIVSYRVVEDSIRAKGPISDE